MLNPSNFSSDHFCGLVFIKDVTNAIHVNGIKIELNKIKYYGKKSSSKKEGSEICSKKINVKVIKKASPKKWFKKVKEISNAMDLKQDVFKSKIRKPLLNL